MPQAVGMPDCLRRGRHMAVSYQYQVRIDDQVDCNVASVNMSQFSMNVSAALMNDIDNRLNYHLNRSYGKDPETITLEIIMDKNADSWIRWIDDIMKSTDGPDTSEKLKKTVIFTYNEIDSNQDLVPIFSFALQGAFPLSWELSSAHFSRSFQLTAKITLTCEDVDVIVVKEAAG